MRKQKEINDLYNHYKNSAKTRNIPFSITKMDLYDLSYPITCPVLGIPLQFNSGKPKDDSYSLDRIDSSKGYDIDNVIVVSYRANILKRDASLLEMKKMVDFYSDLASSKSTNLIV